MSVAHLDGVCPRACRSQPCWVLLVRSAPPTVLLLCPRHPCEQGGPPHPPTPRPQVFSKVGDVKRIVMGLDKHKLTPCGFCFVVYYTREDTEDCVK